MVFCKSMMLTTIIALASCAPVAAPKLAPSTDTISTIDNMAEEDLPKSVDFRKIFPSWYVAVEPFRIVGSETSGVYYVGTEGLAVYLIQTDDGHVVIDGGMPGQGQYVADAIRKLGFDPVDIKILLNSHAHLDHSGGLAALKQLSGAQMIASEGDRSALEGGFYLGSESDTARNAPPVKVDRIIADGEVVEHGGVKLTAHITPGHTRGCTSWTMVVERAGRSHEVLFFCSATVAANRLIGPPQYEGIVDDYRKTFAITKDWQPDMFLSNHPEFFGMAEKRKTQLAGDPEAFVGKGDFPKFITKMAVDFDAGLKKQELKHNAVMSE